MRNPHTGSFNDDRDGVAVQCADNDLLDDVINLSFVIDDLLEANAQRLHDTICQ